jgi:hypothetical protein
MKAVHVFGRGDCVEQGLCVHLGRQRQLDQNPVNLVAGIEAGDQGEHLLGADRGGRRNQLAVEAQIGAGLHLAADINLRCGHVAHQHCRQPRPDALRRQRADLLGHFLLDRRGNRHAIENPWHSSAPKLYRIVSCPGAAPRESMGGARNLLYFQYPPRSMLATCMFVARASSACNFLS